MEERGAVADDFFNCGDGDNEDLHHYDQYQSEEEKEEDRIEPTTYAQGDYETDTTRGKLSIGGVGAEEEDSFASDFYRSGSDWSCLLQIDDRNATQNTSTSSTSNNNDNGGGDHNDEVMRRKKRLKQTNLVQMWGFHNRNPFTPNLEINSGKSSDYTVIRGESSKDTTNTTTAPQFAHQRPRPRVCPFYKKIPGTPFTVDAFRYGNVEGCSVYFLSHFHADHYGGLSKKWSHGPIYCTPLTARLVIMLLSVNPLWIQPLELGREIVIQGIKVTMLEANHCPGAALIHFRLPNGKCYLHTGDFRASKLMQSYSLLMNQQIHVLYLDTTYCNPKYRFPPKEDVLNFVVRVTKNHIKKQPNSLVIVGAYSIGKECVYLAISKALGVKVYANPSRRRILQSFGRPEISGNLCMHGMDTPLHVLPISSLKFETLEHYLETYKNQYKSVLAFRPTGWTYSDRIGSQLDLIKPSSKGRVTIYGVPYSEHSSFTELRDFVQFLRPDRIIPTVNVGNAANRDKMQSYFREWMKGP